MYKKDIPFLIKILNSLFPNAKTELYYNNNFQLLLAILMSAQTTDKQVNKVNKIFFQHIVTPNDIIELGIEKIKSFIKSISFFNNKAKYIYETSIIIKEKYNSSPPKTIKELTELPGVGIKTAKVFLAVSENAPYIGVDTHVHRILNRLGLAKTNSPIKTDKQIDSIFNKTEQINLHNHLVLFGRYYCTAKRPKCSKCKLNEKCDYYKKLSL